MESNLENEVLSKTITLEINDKQNVLNDLSITYSNYGHEHVSSGPDEPFAASVGVYVFLLSDKNSSESITFEWDLHQNPPEPKRWKNYSITLIRSSEDQKKVVLKIVRTKIK